jgi:hypothetical protein
MGMWEVVLFGAVCAFVGLQVLYWVIRLAVRHALQDVQTPAATDRAAGAPSPGGPRSPAT